MYFEVDFSGERSYVLAYAIIFYFVTSISFSILVTESESQICALEERTS